MELLVKIPKRVEDITTTFELLRALNDLTADHGVSTEGFGLTVWAGTVTLFNRMTTMFKENVLAAIGMLKQSELSHYHNLHSDRFNRVTKQDYNTISKMEAFVPTGMRGQYIDAVMATKDLYNVLNALVVMEGFHLFLQKFYSKLSREDIAAFDMLAAYVQRMQSITDGDAKAARVIAETTAVKINTTGELDKRAEETIINILQTIDERVQEYRRFDYDDQKINSAYTFNTVFNSVKDYQVSYKELLNMKQRMTDASALYDIMNKIDEQLDTINTWLQGHDTVPKERAELLATVVRIFAITLSHYGFALATQMKLEHNIILTTQCIHKQLLAM